MSAQLGFVEGMGLTVKCVRALLMLFKNVSHQVYAVNHVLKFSHRQNMMKALPWGISINHADNFQCRIKISQWLAMKTIASRNAEMKIQ